MMRGSRTSVFRDSSAPKKDFTRLTIASNIEVLFLLLVKELHLLPAMPARNF